MQANEILTELAKLWEERNTTYGNSYHDAGHLFTTLFPEGLTLQSQDDFNRFAVLNFMISKLYRYCINFNNNPDPDHLKDLTVYTAMLSELDQ